MKEIICHDVRNVFNWVGFFKEINDILVVLEHGVNSLTLFPLKGRRSVSLPL